MVRIRQVALVLGMLFALVGPGAAAESDDRTLIDDAAQAVQALRQQYPRPVADALARAKGAVVYPTLYQGGFIVGGGGGPGVLSKRQPDGSWSNPAFYGYIAGSVGLQIGVKGSSVLIAVMTDAALNRLMQGNFKLGADASLAAGPVGGGGEIASVARGADLLVYSRDSGLFAGGAFNGASLTPSEDRNHEFYGPRATPQLILSDSRKDPASASLRAALAGTPPATARVPPR